MRYTKAFIPTLLIVASAVHSFTGANDANSIRFVNPLIGTQKMGHTFPGATVPFGSVQLSPDTDQQPHNIGGKYNKDAYKYCAGYQYDDREIVGFSHTHFSGTGHSRSRRFFDNADDRRAAARTGNERLTGNGFSFRIFARKRNGRSRIITK